MTLTFHVHDAPGAKVTVSIERKVAPATALMLPPQLLASPFGVATTSPPGRLSEKLTLVSVVNVAFGLVTVKVNDVDWPIRMLAAPNALLSVGGAGSGTVSDADALSRHRTRWTRSRWSRCPWCPPRWRSR